MPVGDGLLLDGAAVPQRLYNVAKVGVEALGRARVALGQTHGTVVAKMGVLCGV